MSTVLQASAAQGDEDVSTISTESARLRELEEELKKKEYELKQHVNKQVEVKSTYVASQVQKITRSLVFHKVKFITSLEMLMGISKSGSIGSFVSGKMQIPRERFEAWWNTYAWEVDFAIKEARNTAISGIKKAWLGEL